MEYSDDFIRELFNSSHSQKEVLEKIGRKPNGSGWRTFCKMAKQINLDLKEFNVKNNKDKYDLNPNFCKCCGVMKNAITHWQEIVLPKKEEL